MALGSIGQQRLDIGPDYNVIELFEASGWGKKPGRCSQSRSVAASAPTRCAKGASQFPIAPADPGAPLPALSFPGGFRTPALLRAWTGPCWAGIRNPSQKPTCSGTDDLPYGGFGVTVSGRGGVSRLSVSTAARATGHWRFSEEHRNSLSSQEIGRAHV